MGVSVNSILDVIEGKSPITKEFAFLMTKAWPQANPSMWLRMQSNYDAWQATHNRK